MYLKIVRLAAAFESKIQFAGKDSEFVANENTKGSIHAGLLSLSLA